MGVTVSSQSSLAPISLASTIIGFLSFALTAATLVRVTWDNLSTFWSAPTEITDMLGNLKAGLHEERRHLRKVCRDRRKRRRSSSAPHRDREKHGGVRVSREDREQTERDRTLWLMRDTIRHFWQRFRDVERPFLAYEEDKKRSMARSRRMQDDEWDTEGLRDDYDQDDNSFVISAYRKCGFRERLIWLREKGQAQALLSGLSMLQTRRIAHEVGHMMV